LGALTVKKGGKGKSPRKKEKLSKRREGKEEGGEESPYFYYLFQRCEGERLKRGSKIEKKKKGGESASPHLRALRMGNRGNKGKKGRKRRGGRGQPFFSTTSLGAGRKN